MHIARVIGFSALAVLGLVTGGPGRAQTADLILLHGRILTLDERSSVREAMAVSEGRIAALGRSTEIMELAGRKTRVVDLRGRTVIPGLIDSHIHAIRAALSYSVEVNWIGTSSLEEALGRIREAARTAKPGDWIIVAGGWTPEQFREVIDVNLMGAYWMAQAAAQVMPPGSSIVNIASLLGLVKSFLPQAAYAASKAGLIGLTRDLNQQWSGRRGIRVNAVAPGYFRSEMTEPIPRDKLEEFIANTSTLGRMGEQHELDTVVVFLASPASSYIAGVTLAVDGGMSGH